MGEAAAVVAALIWAIASIIYARLGQSVDSRGLNLAKGVIAIAFLLVTPTLWFQNWAAVTPLPIALLFASGLMGVGLGDTFFFETLKAMGPRRTLLLEAWTPTITAALAWIILRETLSPLACGGILITLGGIFWVIRERTPEKYGAVDLRRGVLMGLGAGGSNAIGALLSRAALDGSLIRPELAALTRIVAGVLLLLIWGVVRGQFLEWCRAIAATGKLKVLVAAAFGSTYLGISLQQVGFKYAPAGVTQTLLATSPLFILPIVTIMGERVSLRAWIGAIVAVGGIGILFLVR